MYERIVAALRRAGQVVFRNLWLYFFSLLYFLSAPFLFLGGTGLPIIFWVASGRYFEPGLLWKDPLSFLLSHWQLVLYSMAGCFVGFSLFLPVLLFYYGALTAVVGAAAPAGTPEVKRLPAGLFWRAGRKYFGGSTATATLASLLPIPTAVILLVIAIFLAFRIPAAIASGNLYGSVALIGAGLAGVAFLALTILLGWAAFLWYRFALCAVCLEDLPAGKAMRRSLSFCSERWVLVLGLVVLSLLLNFLSGALLTPFSLLSGMWKHLSFPVALALKALTVLLALAAGVFVDLWLKAALVVLYRDNRS